MKKRGQILGELFRYLLIILVIVLIIIFGFKGINKIRSASCTTSLVLFKDNLKKSVESRYSEVGSINEERFNVPCEVDKVYFVDLGKDMDRLFKSLNEYPLIKNAIEDNVGKNAFLVKNDNVIGSFYAGDIELQKPYFVCSDTSKGNLDLYLGGKGSSAEVVNKECAFDCTFEVVEVDYEAAREIMKNASGKCSGCPEGDLDDELKLYNETKKFVKIARRCNCGRKPGEAVVEILIKPEGKVEQFKLIEKIPKDYVDDLYNYEPIVSGGDTVKVISDPLIMWHFDVLDKETIVSYTLDTDVFEYCADVLETIGYGIPTLSDELDLNDYNLTAIKREVEKDDPLNLALPTKVIEIGKGKTNNSVFNKPVWHFVSDTNVTSRSTFKGYTYEISSDGTNYAPQGAGAFYSGPTYPNNQDYISCLLDNPAGKIVRCNVGGAFSGVSAVFYIKVTDARGDFSVDKFTVRVDSSPGVDCSSNTNEIACGSGCEWCLECDGMRYSGGSNRCVNAGECPYTCDTIHCNAECNSITKCWDGCYDEKYYYECGSIGCGDDCTCLPLPADPSLVEECGLMDDRDGDTYHGYCDCLDDPNNPVSVNVYPGSNNPYCDCNKNTPSNLAPNGAMAGIPEICDDNMDNDCDGVVDNCYYKLKCWEEKYTDCQDECDPGDCVGEFGAGWQLIDEFWGWGCWPWDEVCKCRRDWETECSESPVCVGGSQVGNPISCVCSDDDGDGYGACPDCGVANGCTYDGDDCNDNNININPGATEVCDDNMDNDCDGTIDNCVKVKFRCYSPIRLTGKHESCGCHHCNMFGNDWTCHGCHGSGKKRAYCSYDKWTECSASPQCPQYTDKVEEKPCCIDNNDCGAGEVCQNEECVVIPCELTAADWYGFQVEERWCGFAWAAHVNDGDEVTLRVEGTTGCKDRTVNFQLWEYDSMGICDSNCGLMNPQQVPVDVGSAIFDSCDDSGCVAERKWNAVWVTDDGGGNCDTGNNPEYSFNASVGQEQRRTNDDYSGNPPYLRVIRVAELAATITQTSKSVSGGYTYYNYNLVIKESNGVGVTLNRGRACYATIPCGSWSYGDRIVPANGQYTASSYWYWSNSESNEYWLEYEGQDNNGNSVSAVSNKLVHPS